MAGLAIAGNLTDLLDSTDDIEIEHRLESVKLLQDDGSNGTDSRHHGYLTAEAVSRPEVNAPTRHGCVWRSWRSATQYRTVA